MTAAEVFLLPAHDGIASAVAARVPDAAVLPLASPDDDTLARTSFLCLPYMQEADAFPLFARMPRLCVVQSLSSGVDTVLAAAPTSVTVCNGRGLLHEESTAELAVALTLAGLRELPTFVDEQRQRRWTHRRTSALYGRRVLLVGYGPMGQAIDARLAPFGVSIERVSRTARPGVQPLEQLGAVVPRVDVVLVCIALSARTRGLINAEILAGLADGALLVNVARAPVVDASALLSELMSGRIRAALDVTDPEPLPADSALWQLPNVLITPHLGGDTGEFVARVPEFLIEQVERHRRGRALANVVRAAARHRHP